MAKKQGIRVEEFGFGIPPRLIGKKIGETIYSINLLPFGGFVRLHGEEEVVEKDKERAFYAKSSLRRLGVIIAGVVMNLLLGIGLFCLTYAFTGVTERGDQVKIVSVASQSPAAEAGLEKGDIVSAVEEEEVTSVDEFVSRLEQLAGQSAQLQIKREPNPCGQKVLGGGAGQQNYSYCDEGELWANVVPRSDPPENEGPLGVVISDAVVRHYPVGQMIPKAIFNGVSEAYFWVREMVGVLGVIGRSLWQGQGLPSGITGPVGIYQATGQVSQHGFWALVHFTGILSINLAVFNLLPFPALDGGRAVFVVLEKAIGPDKRRRAERWANTAGMVLLIALLLLVTFRDVRRLLDLKI